VHFPAGYQPSGPKFPLLIFMHGSGELGNGTTELVALENAGLPQVMKNATAAWNDAHIPMIVVSPQIPPGFDWDWYWTGIEDAYNYAIAHCWVGYRLASGSRAKLLLFYFGCPVKAHSPEPSRYPKQC
jgi:hypothetical protein